MNQGKQGIPSTGPLLLMLDWFVSQLKDTEQARLDDLPQSDLIVFLESMLK